MKKVRTQIEKRKKESLFEEYNKVHPDPVRIEEDLMENPLEIILVDKIDILKMIYGFVCLFVRLRVTFPCCWTRLCCVMLCCVLSVHKVSIFGIFSILLCSPGPAAQLLLLFK